MKILSTTYHEKFPAWTFPDWAAEELRQKFPDYEVVKVTSRERAMQELPDTDVLLTWMVRPEFVSIAKRLRWIHTGMAGLTWILIPEVVNSEILVSNSKGVHAIPIAEHTIGLMLQFSRRLAPCLDDQRSGVWRRREIYESRTSFTELYGKTLCILGIGAIGAEIARRARAFNMRILGIRKHSVLKVECADAVYPPQMVNEILPAVDYLIIAAPATDETKGMIDRAQFDRMKRTPFLVNISRGDVINQQALMDALNNERIAGAGLDVFVPDPLPDGHPLFSTKNLIITPHVSGVSDMLWRRIMDIWIENIHRFRTGKALINQVDKKRGY